MAAPRKSHWMALEVRPNHNEPGFLVWAVEGKKDDDGSVECYCQQGVCAAAIGAAGLHFDDEKKAERAARRAKLNVVRPCEVCGSFTHVEEYHTPAGV